MKGGLGKMRLRTYKRSINDLSDKEAMRLIIARRSARRAPVVPIKQRLAKTKAPRKVSVPKLGAGAAQQLIDKLKEMQKR